jgi:hypothetical protein
VLLGLSELVGLAVLLGLSELVGLAVLLGLSELVGLAVQLATAFLVSRPEGQSRKTEWQYWKAAQARQRPLHCCPCSA